MTRKRYVKLLMAMGVTRDQANTYALLCRMAGRPYKEDYGMRAPWLNVQNAAHRIVVKLGAALAEFGIGVQKAIENIQRLRGAFVGLDLANGPDKTGYILPLTTSNLDGYVTHFSAVDEVSQWPKENPYLGGGGND